MLREYVWLDDRPLAVVADAGGSSPQIWQLHTDHLERPVMMTDDAQNVVWKATYLPFGEVSTVLGSATLDMRFPGQWFQLESGLHYNWNRHYDPTTGRYIQPDPLGMPDGPARWAYVVNSPLMWTDPEGLASQSLPLLGPAGGSLCIPGRQIRIYNACGAPFCDIDLNHDHGQGSPHLHFWGTGGRGPGISIPDRYK